MKRTVAVALVTVGMISGGVAATAPAQAATLKTTSGPLAKCYPSIADQCGGYLWVKLPWSKVPETERDAYLSYTLRNSKGKKIRLTDMYSANVPGGEDGYIDSDSFDDALLYYKNEKIGPLVQLPSNLKAGKYKLTLKVDASGYWDCSITYHSVCKWRKPYVWKKTVTVRLAPRAPLRWTDSEFSP